MLIMSQRGYWDIPKRTRSRKANEVIKGFSSSSSSSSEDDEALGSVPFIPDSPIRVSPPRSPIRVSPVDMDQGSDSTPSQSQDNRHGSEHHSDVSIEDHDENDQEVIRPIPLDLPIATDFDSPEPSDDSNSEADGEDDGDEAIQHERGIDNPIMEGPLYPTARITKAESFLSVLALSKRHKLTGTCVADILHLLDLHCPEPTLTINEYEKYFAEIQTPLQYFLYCNQCYGQCDVESTCENCGDTTVSYFTLFPIVPQLKVMFSRNGFYDKLDYRIFRQKININNVEDIFDGELYQDHCSDGGFLNQKSSISFMWYADGANVFKSSKISVWPMFLSVNELPISDRLLKENVLLAGLWCGPVKPIGNLMLAPLKDQMRDLFQGVPMTVPGQGEVNVKALILCGTADTPAREAFMCVNSHSGECSCTKCKQRGERVEHVQVFPYEPEVILRTDENIRRDADLALQLQLNEVDGHISGVKGLTEFSNLIPNFVRAIAIDEMHNVQGVIKKLLKLWFDPSFHMFNFNRSAFVFVVDERLKKIKAPMFIKRKPRSIKEHLAYFKMSELKSIGLYYSIPILQGIISVEHLRHFMLLVTAVWLLSRRSIPIVDINLAESLLKKFVERFADLYSLRFLTINVHQLIHLAPMVKDLGPLWVTSCFGFEDLNGQILSIVHGTRFTERQISSSVQLHLTLPQLVSEMNNGPAKDFCSRMLLRGRKPKIIEEIDERTGIVGKCIRISPVPEDVRQVLVDNNVAVNNVFEFEKLCKGSLVYTTSAYDRGKSTNSSCIKFTKDGMTSIGRIRKFIKLLDCQCLVRCNHSCKCYAIVNVCQIVASFTSEEPYVQVPHIHKYRLSDESVLVKPSQIDEMNVIMYLHDGIYIAQPPLMSECNV